MLSNTQKRTSLQGREMLNTLEMYYKILIGNGLAYRKPWLIRSASAYDTLANIRDKKGNLVDLTLFQF
jgi:hypothetical protein